jgi:hypothetical protein
MTESAHLDVVGVHGRRERATQLWISVGAALFLVALAVSAWALPQLRLLHMLQAVIYIATVILAYRNSAWGFGAGATMAVAWNSLNLFVTHLMEVGAVAFWHLVRTGRVEALVPMMVALGGIAHFILLAACLVAILQQRSEPHKWWKFMGGGLVSIAYLVLIVVIANPRR